MDGAVDGLRSGAHCILCILTDHRSGLNTVLVSVSKASEHQ